MKTGLQDNCIDRVGMAAIVIVCVGYVLFGSSFAQLRLEFSFLNFPIFIGEVLLGFTTLLFIVKSAGGKWELGRWWWILAVYFLFVLFKAFSGYFVWGPLAFRDAALFYYPFFAVLGYSFWSDVLWGDKTRYLVLIVILSILILRQFNSFWPCPLIIMGVILALQAKSFKERMALIGAVFLFAPYGVLFNVLFRTVFLSSVITATCIGIVFLFLFCKDRWVRIVVLVLGGIVLGVIVFKFGQTDIGKTFVIKNTKPLAVGLIQESPRGTLLFQPVGSCPQKPDAIKEFFQRMSGILSFIENKTAIKENKTAVERNKTAVEENRPVIKENRSVVEENKPAIEANKPAVEENRPVVEANRPVIKENMSVVEEHKMTFDEYKAAMEGNKAVVGENIDILRIKEDNTLFRYYIWRDMAHEYARYKPIFGFDFGRPLYSPSLLKDFGASTPQDRDGWVGAHNSFFYMIYRAGIVGLAMVLFVYIFWFGLLRDFYNLRDWTGILLCAIFLNWIVAANFFLIFELPYTAIPVWTILGITVKHRMLLKIKN